MKALLVMLLAGWTAADLLAQGQFTLGNKNLLTTPVIDAKIFTYNGTALAGADFWTQAYVKLAADPDSSFAAVGSAVNFRTGANAGYIVPVVVTTPFAGNTEIHVQMRAWAASSGNTYEAAVAAGGYYGAMMPVTLTVTTAPNTPPDMVGLASFNLVPEPATLALGVLGACLLLWRRRSG